MSSDWSQSGKQKGDKNPWGKDKQGIEILISNYPIMKSTDAIMSAISLEVLSRFGGLPVFKSKKPVPDGIRAVLANNQQFQALLSCNGMYIFNQKIWIIKFPLAVGAYTTWFARIFVRYTSNGIVDLSNLRDKLKELEVPDKLLKDANFNNRDFVEFLFYRLGTESRDSRFFVETVLLNGNNINMAQKLAPFLVFLPTLRRLVLNDNPIKVKEDGLFLPQCPFVEVVCERASKAQPNKPGPFKPG